MLIRIYADFNDMIGSNKVALTSAGSKLDLVREKNNLSPESIVAFYCEEFDVQGHLEYDEKLSQYVALVDWNTRKDYHEELRDDIYIVRSYINWNGIIKSEALYRSYVTSSGIAVQSCPGATINELIEIGAFKCRKVMIATQSSLNEVGFSNIFRVNGRGYLCCVSTQYLSDTRAKILYNVFLPMKNPRYIPTSNIYSGTRSHIRLWADFNNQDLDGNIRINSKQANIQLAVIKDLSEGMEIELFDDDYSIQAILRRTKESNDDANHGLIGEPRWDTILYY